MGDGRGGQAGRAHRLDIAKVFLTGLKNPLAATVTNNRLLIGDWTTGRIYSIARS